MHYVEVAVLGSPLAPLTYQTSSLLAEGQIVTISLQNKKRQGVVIRYVDQPSFTCLDLDSQDNGSFLTAVVLQTASFIAAYYHASLGEALQLFVPFTTIKPLEPVLLSHDIQLSQPQNEALELLDQHETALLFGDTGSGKTEIYIHLIQRVLNEGGQAILLMPEIGLTPQMEKRLSHHFGGLVALWHSKQTKKTKEKILEKIAKGDVRIVAGARSALFLPFAHLKLIIVDEEHDDSYKSSSRPRLHARDVALYYGGLIKAKVVLGSATPSLSSFYRYPIVRLKGTYFPSTRTYEFITPHERLSPLVFDRIGAALAAQQQVIVFVPTRANFKMISCPACGQSVQCPYCSVAMSLHKTKKALVCHYCHYVEPIATSCPSCETSTLQEYRIGTDEIVTLLQEAFPQKTIQKFDRDEVTTEKRLKTILGEFNDGKIDILVGTQMLAKGHDYHRVGLAVILGIDYLLGMPDYRAREKALQLFLQISGRTGRKGSGKVVIESHNEDFFRPYIDNYESFLGQELADRGELYPPKRRLARIVASHTQEAKAKELIEQVALSLMKVSDLDVVGYGPAAIAKIASKYRYDLLVRSKAIKPLQEALRQIGHPALTIDQDPVNLT